MDADLSAHAVAGPVVREVGVPVQAAAELEDTGPPEGLAVRSMARTGPQGRECLFIVGAQDGTTGETYANEETDGEVRSYAGINEAFTALDQELRDHVRVVVQTLRIALPHPRLSRICPGQIPG